MSSEEWRPVVGYEGHYEVSDLGRVRSVVRIDALGRSIGGRILKPGEQRSGHLLVSLWRDGRGKSVSVHRIVGEAFIGPLPSGEETRHLDGDPTNNRRTNLEYGTRSANMLDRVAHGTHHHSRRVTCRRGHQLSGANLRAAAARAGNRQCRACGWEHSRSHNAGEPFDAARADENYVRITQEVAA